MTTLIDQIKFEEGLRLNAYLCTAGRKTIGYGHNLDANPYLEGGKIPDQITHEQAEAILANDIRRTTEQLHAAWHGIGLLQGARHDAVVQMAFQLGVDGLLGFRMMLKVLLQCDWQKAYKEALDSDWARQTPARAERVANQILTGVYYDVF